MLHARHCPTRTSFAWPDGTHVFANLSLALRSGRTGLVGRNGAGKKTLLRLIAGEFEPGAGRIRRSPTPVRLLPQRLDLLDDGRSVPANFRRCAPGAPDGELRNRLAGFLFGGDTVHLPVADLPGGERLRATMACWLATEPAPQLLLLDEPINNLDLVSVGQLRQALAAYQGRCLSPAPT